MLYNSVAFFFLPKAQATVQWLLCVFLVYFPQAIIVEMFHNFLLCWVLVHLVEFELSPSL